MKNISLPVVFLLCLNILLSCRKNHAVLLASQLEGSWELRILYGSQIPGIGPNFSPGNGDIWKFTNSVYERYTNGQLTSNGTYTLTKAETFATGTPEAALIFDNNTHKIHFGIIRDTLTIYNRIIPADGYVAKYVRQ